VLRQERSDAKLDIPERLGAHGHSLTGAERDDVPDGRPSEDREGSIERVENPVMGHLGAMIDAELFAEVPRCGRWREDLAVLDGGIPLRRRNLKPMYSVPSGPLRLAEALENHNAFA